MALVWAAMSDLQTAASLTLFFDSGHKTQRGIESIDMKMRLKPHDDPKLPRCSHVLQDIHLRRPQGHAGSRFRRCLIVGSDILVDPVGKKKPEISGLLEATYFVSSNHLQIVG